MFCKYTYWLLHEKYSKKVLSHIRIKFEKSLKIRLLTQPTTLRRNLSSKLTIMKVTVAYLSYSQSMRYHLDVVLALAVWQVLTGSGPDKLFGSVHYLSALKQHFSLDEHPRNVRRAEPSYPEGDLTRKVKEAPSYMSLRIPSGTFNTFCGVTGISRQNLFKALSTPFFWISADHSDELDDFWNSNKIAMAVRYRT